eukprot:1158974-Pelagomonas_calceolata.AAC.8
MNSVLREALRAMNETLRTAQCMLAGSGWLVNPPHPQSECTSVCAGHVLQLVRSQLPGDVKQDVQVWERDGQIQRGRTFLTCLEMSGANMVLDFSEQSCCAPGLACSHFIFMAMDTHGQEGPA